MKEFTLKPNDIPINLTPEQEKAIVSQVLSIFDGDWCFILTGLSMNFNQKSERIIWLHDRVEKLRQMVGEINNERISLWQQEYFKHESIEKQTNRIS